MNPFQIRVTNRWAVIRGRYGATHPIWIDQEGLTWWWQQSAQEWHEFDMSAPYETIEIVIRGEQE